jgi:SprT protein
MLDIPKKRKASPFSQLEFCFESTQPLPSSREIQERATSLLRALGAGALALRLQVEWNSRLTTTVGRADSLRCIVSLNPLLQRFGQDEIDRTLRHELAHLLAQFRAGRRRILVHGPEWRLACHDLGIGGERACHKLPLEARRLPRPYVYRCCSCLRFFPRARRIRRATACLACCRKFSSCEYDDRFRLQLVRRPMVK